MNILPHKSWHVRTKKNIARVRKDEAQAAEEEKERQRKIALAAQEARTALLRERAGVRLASAAATAPIGADTEVAIPLAPVTDIIQQDGHVNFFQDVQDGKRQVGINDEAESEKKAEQEEYEKKIGYLVYLGQDSLEASKQKPWYAKIDRGGGKVQATNDFDKIKDFEKSGYLDGLSKDCKLTTEEVKLAKFKSFQDPLKDIRKYLKTPGIAQKLDESKSKVALKRKYEESTSSKSSLFPSTSSSPSSSKSKPKKVEKEKKKKSKKAKKHKHEKGHRHKESKKKKSKDKDRPLTPLESSSTSEEDSEDERKRKTLENLRAERLEREREEKRRADQLLAKLRGDTDPEEKRKAAEKNSEPVRAVKQRYNSQFNPELARQNYDFR